MPDTRLCTALAATLLALTLAAAPPATAPAPAPEARWSSVIQRLASNSFKEREDAQKEVDAATWRDLSTLKALVAKTSDAEVSTRLTSRIEALQLQASIDPPPIDIDLDDAGLSSIPQVLADATDVPWKQIHQARIEATFTLHAKEKPLWDIFLALSAQHPLGIFRSPDGMQVMMGSRAIVRGDVEGPLLFYPQTLNRTAELQAPDPPAANVTPSIADRMLPPPKSAAPSLQLQFGVIGDPRLNFSRAYAPEITDVVDDNGTVIHHHVPALNGFIGGETLLQTEQVASWPIPQNLGKKISIKGSMKITLILSQLTVQIPDMVKQGDTPILLGNQEIIWQKFEVAGNAIMCKMTIRRAGNAPAADPLPPSA